MNPFQPEYLILHDYGGTPGANPKFNPYHALVSGGGISYRNPNDPYSAPAPHAYKLNPKSIGLSWGGKVGGMPSKDEFALLKKEYDAIRKRFPNIKVLSHGEAYQQTRGTGQQASKAGRGLEEAAWRKYLLGDLPYEPGTVTPSGPVPMAQRSLTAVAGHTQTQPQTTGAPQPMAEFQNVGGQAPVMDPAEVARRQNMAKMLMQSGLNPGQMNHWTQALGAVLQGGAGVYQGKQAEQGLAQGQQSGNAALAAMLQGGDPNAAMSNPYVADQAMKVQMMERERSLRSAEAERLLKMKLESAASGSSDPAIVQTYKFRQGLPEAERAEFDRVQRAQQWQDLGTSVINPRTGEKFEKDLAGAEAQKVRGRSEEEKRQNFPRVKANYEMANMQDKYVVQDIDNALAQAGPWTTGFAGSVGKFVAGSPQSDLSYTLQSIEANLAFDKLEQIKAASPTGGALGQVTERELDLLRATWGSIQQAQSEEQFKYYLNRLKEIKSEYSVLRQRAYEEDLAKFGPQAVPGSMAPVEVQQPAERIWNPATGRLE